jgi:hypothetical protein
MDSSGREAPRDFFDVVRSGDEAARQGRIDEALEIYDLAAELGPGHGLPFTRKAIVQFRAAFGAPRAPRQAARDRAAVSMSVLGGYGQFGNQLLQYAFLRLYAAAHGLEAQAPDWIGRDLFDLVDPLPEKPLPMLDEAQADLFASLRRESMAVHSGADLKGYFCTDMRRWGDVRDAWRALFAPSPKLRPLIERAVAALRRRGSTLVAVHVRRRDFGYGRYWIAPEAWYLDWLRERWPALERPVLYVASDDAQARERFAEFSPACAADLDVEMPGAGFFLDHSILREADVLAIANSSFSFTASLLNSSAAEFVRPDPASRRLVPFEPWSSPVLVDAPLRPHAREAILALLRPQDRVLYVGEYCSDWANAARAAHPQLRIRETDLEATLDELWSRGEFDALDHLVIGAECDAARVLQGARESLDFGRIAAVHFRAGGRGEAENLLRESGYEIRSLDADNRMAIQS